jgi:hypothetical protein
MFVFNSKQFMFLENNGCGWQEVAELQLGSATNRDYVH